MLSRLLPLLAILVSNSHYSTAATLQLRNGTANSNSTTVTTLPHPRLNQTVYKALFEQPSNSTPTFKGTIDNPAGLLSRNLFITRQAADGTSGDGTCAPGSPCVNGACCSDSGFCGYAPDFCGEAHCISNCDAKAQCGQYAAVGKEICPLNVCCSQFGFCGTSEDFCGDGCDTAGGQCGDAPEPSGKSSSLFRTIGYYESWSSKRDCDAVEPDDLDLTALTHLNFAFAFFHPSTFQITAMDSNAQSLLTKFTGLKSKKRSLRTWISVGGWSFNDPGNNPDTRAAFSNMASSAANRATFTSSLISFMDTYGFDGVDIDWEYPVAEDRGGKPEDKANYVTLCQELKAAFNGKYGLSVTLPASYWYLQNFDVKAMEPHVDWFNVMTYDIHGVWDGPNEHTGPYVRPHTNLTEINQGLSLLWRAGVEASNVVIGLAFYGRSFTLEDPTCSEPWCRFSEGGKAGECTNAAGILSISEITKIIQDKDPETFLDTEAAVKWITWDDDQWVSYDDENTFTMKTDYAMDTGLSGFMVWAIDQGVKGESNTKVSGGFGLRAQVGYSDGDVEMVQDYVDAADSCYVTFCGGECATGYVSRATMRGQVGLLPGSECMNDQFQQLCCLSGTIMGKCKWNGWRGQGLSCFGGSCPIGDTLVTTNTNYYARAEDTGYVEDSTCVGGTMSLCCRGWQPALSKGKDIQLIQSRDVDSDPVSISKRDLKTCAAQGLVSGGALVLLSPAAGPAAPIVDLAALALTGVVTLFCLIGDEEASVRQLAGYDGTLTRGQAANLESGRSRFFPPPVKPPTRGGPKKNADGKLMFGRYEFWDLEDKDTCETTYTCEYGLGFDQVCDNQRWGLDQITYPVSIFNYDYSNGPRPQRMKQQWFYTSHRNADWYQTFGNHALHCDTGLPGRCRCEADEFPLNSLVESGQWAMQAIRQLDGNENGRQGRDWQDWLYATWWPCSEKLNAPPPVTWAIGMDAVGDNDGRKTAAPNEVIRKYGFDSSSGKDPCYGTWAPANSVNPDHGFRVMNADPLIVAHGWPRQNYRSDADGLAPSDRPTSVNSAAYLKRDVTVGMPYFGAMGLPPPTAMADATPRQEVPVMTTAPVLRQAIRSG